MKEYTKKSEKQSRTLDSNSKVSKQVLNDMTPQRYAVEEDEKLVQGKFKTVQREIKNKELESNANKLIEIINSNPENVDTILLRSTMKKLMNEYELNDENDILTIWQDIKDALGNNIVKVLKPLLTPLFTHIRLQIKTRLKNDTPKWVENLPNIKITKGKDISGGLAVGADEIFVTPRTGADFILNDTVEFAFSHEIAHLISKQVGVSKAKGLLRSNGAIKNSGITIDSVNSDKLEEIRADIFGVDMLASYLKMSPSNLSGEKISEAINAPRDREHPSFEERKNMINYFRGINFESEDIIQNKISG